MSDRSPHIQNTISYGNILVAAGMIIGGVIAYNNTDNQVKTNATNIVKIENRVDSHDVRLRGLEQDNRETNVKLENIEKSIRTMENLQKEILEELRKR